MVSLVYGLDTEKNNEILEKIEEATRETREEVYRSREDRVTIKNNEIEGRSEDKNAYYDPEYLHHFTFGITNDGQVMSKFNLDTWRKRQAK